MARFDRYEPGQFSWVDPLTPDPKAAAAFYGALFGWTHEAAPEDQGDNYTMFQKNGIDVAGMGGMGAEMIAAGVPPSWNSYVSVEDVDATVARAESLGAGVTNEPDTFGWNELCSRDPAASAKFYESLFGWKTRPAEGGEGYLELLVGDRLNGGILPWTAEMGDIPPNWAVYFALSDCDATVARVQELGGALLMAPVDIPSGRFAVVADPQGAVFDVAFLHAPDD